MTLNHSSLINFNFFQNMRFENDRLIYTDATLTEVVGDHTYLAKLPNGKIVYAHTAKIDETMNVNLHSGTTVELEMTPFDMDKGRIVKPLLPK